MSNPAINMRTSDAAAWPIQGLIRHFRPEIENRIAKRKGFVAVPAMQQAAE